MWQTIQSWLGFSYLCDRQFNPGLSLTICVTEESVPLACLFSWLCDRRFIPSGLFPVIFMTEGSVPQLVFSDIWQKFKSTWLILSYLFDRRVSPYGLCFVTCIMEDSVTPFFKNIFHCYLCDRRLKSFWLGFFFVFFYRKSTGPGLFLVICTKEDSVCIISLQIIVQPSPSMSLTTKYLKASAWMAVFRMVWGRTHPRWGEGLVPSRPHRGDQ